MGYRYFLAVLLPGLLVVPGVARADGRDYCPTRPGLDDTPCTIDAGRVSVESALADWTRESDASSRTDTILLGDTLVRVGLTHSIEAQVGWTPYGHVHMLDKDSGSIDRSNGVGDVLVGFKANLHNPDGGTFAIAVRPFATLPAGGSAIGAGDWGAGLTVPMSYKLSKVFSLQSTAEIDAAVDEDGTGRHLAYSEALGLVTKLSKTVRATLEVQALRDQDPEEHNTQGYAALSFSWSANKNLQFDVGGVAGLTRAAADVELSAGVSRRF
jgi:hypothetical protein